MIGRRLSHFEILEEIGAGGMGVVYKATDLRLQRTVALKLLPPESIADAARRDRFVREARAASALNHPHIVTVHEIDAADGVDFIAMEYLDGRSLDHIITPRGIELPRALKYAIQIAEALSAAHAHGIVHRDVKPRNIVVTRAGNVKLLDFGLAKLLPTPTLASEPPTESQITAPGRILGTAAYMSPEQARGAPADARSDIFSFGVVVYEMLTGQRPFRGESLALLLSAILRDVPQPLRSVRSDLPQEIARIVEKALEKGLEYRYQNIGDVLSDLKRLQRDSGSRAAVSDPAPARAATRRRLRTAAVVAIAVAGLALAAWRLRSRRSPALHPGQFHLVSSFPGSHRAPSFSPDGRMVAFIDTARGVPQVWVRPIGEGDPIQATSGEVAAGRPRWSPKGNEIIFERRGQGLWTVPPLGGSPRQVLERGSCPGFFPDGERLVFDRGPELWTARVDGSEARRLEGVPVNYFSFYIKRCAAASPDGRWVAFYQPARGPLGDYWVVAASGGEPRRLTFDSAEGGSLAWTPDGRFVVFSSARRGSRTLWQVPAAGGEPEPLTTGAGEDVEPDISRDGRKLIYSNARNAFAIMLLDYATGRQRQILERRSHTNGAVFSPDGSRIAFFATTDRLEQIFTIEVGGGDLRQITSGAGTANIMPRWSADGSFLYFYRQLPAPSFRRVAAAGGSDSTVIDGWRWEVQGATAVDPTDRVAAYSLWKGGRVEATRLRDLQTGAERSLAQPLDDVRWSRDGSALLGADPAGNVVVCRADGGDCETLGKGTGAGWSGDGRRIFLRRSGQPLDDPNLRSDEVWSMARDGSAARRIAALEPQQAIGTLFDVSPRDEIVWVQFRRGREELWLADLPQR